MKKVIAQIKRATNYNEHTKSVIILAAFMHDGYSKQELEMLERRVKQRGWIEQDEMDYRRKLLNGLLHLVKLQYGQKAHDQFYSSF